MSGLTDLIEKQRKYYKSIVSVNCPILQDTVYFTAEGFNHLLYESNRMPRKVGEQFMKLKCLEHAVTVVLNCERITETRKLQKYVKSKLKTVVRHELIHEVEKGKKMRVVVEKIGTGKHKFLSIMPNDKKSKPKKRQKRRS